MQPKIEPDAGAGEPGPGSAYVIDDPYIGDDTLGSSSAAAAAAPEEEENSIPCPQPAIQGNARLSLMLAMPTLPPHRRAQLTESLGISMVVQSGISDAAWGSFQHRMLQWPVLWPGPAPE